MKIVKPMLVALVTMVAGVQYAHAINLAEYDIDPKFRAKLAKEKAKQNTIRGRFTQFGDGEDQQACGSQNIGNVDTGGRPGTGPREVFVFAPNSINVVSGRGCQ